MRDVVVTGLGAVTPLGLGARALHEGWAAGASGIVDGEGACHDFSAADHLPRKQARRADRFTQLALVAAAEAVAQADLPGGERVGCVLGTGVGGLATIETGQDALRDKGAASVPVLSVPMLMGNASAGAVALAHDLRGPVYGVVSACAAGAHAIGQAARHLLLGEADAIVCGGSEAALTPLAKAAFAALDATSPTGSSRPFDARRDGFVMGEGAGVLVLETAEHAAARGATVLAHLRGYGATCDAHHLTAPDPSGAGARRAIELALADAELDPSHVDYVNAHGTGTALNDRAETQALHAALGDRAREVPVSSLKSAIGHLLGAAGAVEAVATVLALQHRIAPPTVGWAERDEGLDLDYVPDTGRPLADRDDGRAPVALSSSFGFGGHNAVLCLEAA